MPGRQHPVCRHFPLCGTPLGRCVHTLAVGGGDSPQAHGCSRSPLLETQGPGFHPAEVDGQEPGLPDAAEDGLEGRPWPGLVQRGHPGAREHVRSLEGNAAAGLVWSAHRHIPERRSGTLFQKGPLGQVGLEAPPVLLQGGVAATPRTSLSFPGPREHQLPDTPAGISLAPGLSPVGAFLQ